MRIHTKATNIHLTPDVSDYLQKKMNMLDRLIDPDDTSVLCDVELAMTSKHHQTGDIYRAEINLRKDGKYFRAEAEEESIIAAIDIAKDEIERTLSNHKSKQQTLIRRGGAAIKNVIRGIGSGIGGGIEYIGGGIGSGVSGGIGAVKKLKNIRWRKRRRDN